MATFEKNTHLAIKTNVDCLSIITRERIFEEIKKAYEQSKDFSYYLMILDHFGILDILYDDINLNKEFRTEKLPLFMHLALLFKPNSTIGLLDKMKFNFIMDNALARSVVFLIDILSISEDSTNILDLCKKREICGITDEELETWFRLTIFNVSTNAKKAFIKYSPSVSATALMSLGFKGMALGNEIKRLERLEFLKLL